MILSRRIRIALRAFLWRYARPRPTRETMAFAEAEKIATLRGDTRAIHRVRVSRKQALHASLRLEAGR